MQWRGIVYAICSAQLYPPNCRTRRGGDVYVYVINSIYIKIDVCCEWMRMRLLLSGPGGHSTYQHLSPCNYLEKSLACGRVGVRGSQWIQ